MPTHKAAYKSIRADAKKRRRNEAAKSELKTMTKNLEKLIADKKKDEALSYIKKISARYMKAASSKVIHKNNASRKISRLSKRINKIG